MVFLEWLQKSKKLILKIKPSTGKISESWDFYCCRYFETGFLFVGLAGLELSVWATMHNLKCLYFTLPYKLLQATTWTVFCVTEGDSVTMTTPKAAQQPVLSKTKMLK